MNTSEIRQAFLDYYQQQQHQLVPSSSLIPGDDPTLLFTNAGMVQFKDSFLGIDKRPYTRATSSQRCVRAGGKHNDLDNVGYTKRHHTFFEMLGNFSFGNYFKREAIQFAWTLLVDVFKLPPDKLWITVYEEDQESEDIWLKEMKVNAKHFSRCGKKDNFWSMGDTGPCGPCTEIFYDHGPEIPGGPPGSPDEDGDRYVEIWNLVFMQYDRDNQGNLTPLPAPCVDTGMGLERIAAVLQGVHDNYDTDLFQALLKALSSIVPCADFQNQSMRVIVDHIRSVAFLIIDGITPSNEGRGYVLRRIIRRAVRHGNKLGQKDLFFHQMVAALVAEMSDAYPELTQQQARIEQVILQEEQQFATTLTKGLKIFDQAVSEISGQVIPGKVVFQLYDTYGFPPDLTADIARERGLSIDEAGFDVAMAKQRAQSQQAQRFNVDYTQQVKIADETTFIGYHNQQSEAVVTTLIHDQKSVDQLLAGQEGLVVLDQTPFYAESGGQVGDRGRIIFNGGEFEVFDTQKQGRAYLHYGHLLQGTLKKGATITALVDPQRQAIVLNHSATHLMHEALREVLGEHVIQKGSLVDAERLRFDFSHPKAVTALEIQAVEQLVNQHIRANIAAEVTEGSLDDAKAQGAMALFGEKYGDVVRVVKMGDFSTEVCGGIHVQRTGDIGLFKITSESACASGVRRIEAVTGAVAFTLVDRQTSQLQQAAELLKTNATDLSDKISQLLEKNRDLSKQVTQLKQSQAARSSGNLGDQAVAVAGFNVLAVQLDAVDRDTLRNTLDQLKQKLSPAAIILASVEDEKIQLVAGISKDCLPHFNATALLNQVAGQVGGKGGGRPDLAQGGGDQPEHLAAALASVTAWVQGKVGV